MERITANLAGKTRRRRYRGREHIVAPLTLIVPGVLSGSKGPLFYPPEEVTKNVGDWNHIPLVVYHPQVNGLAVSARSPDILESQGIGEIFNAKAGDSGSLQAEGWFDVEKTNHVDNRVLESLESEKPIPLSTGLFTQNEAAEEGANHNGIAYDAIARNFRPDHLAILPDQTGACSIKDGCGVLVNAKAILVGFTDRTGDHNHWHQSMKMVLVQRA